MKQKGGTKVYHLRQRKEAGKMKGESKMRKAEAYWMEKYNRWQIVAYRCGVRRSFYSGKPGKLGKHEAEAKAFLEYLTGPKASAVFEAVGFSPISE